VGEACLLGGDQGAQLLVDGHEDLAVHLVIDVPQMGRALGVGDEAVVGQPGRVADPKAASDQDEVISAPSGVGARRDRTAFQP